MDPLMTGGVKRRPGRWLISWWLLLAFGLALVILLTGRATHAAGFQPPEECQAYTGEAHLNCLYAVIELQQGKLGKIEDELKAQKNQLGALSDQVERKESSSSLEKAAPLPPERQVYVPVPSPMYAYPPYYGWGAYGYGYGPSIGLFIGPRYFYGPRYWGGPRIYGRGFYGPRFRRW
jgi:hypothetical protein